MTKPFIIRTPQDFAEHIRRVEAYIAGDDPDTKLRRRLERGIKAEGPTGLSRAELCYYALDAFITAAFENEVNDFFADQPDPVLDGVAECLGEIGEEGKIPIYEQLREKYPLPSPPEIVDGVDDELAQPFVSDCMQLEYLLGVFADAHGLFERRSCP